MLSLDELKKHVKNKTSNNKRVLSNDSEIVNFIEISILLDLDSGQNKFTVLDIDDIHYYINKKQSKKDIRQVVIKELESSNYTYHIVSRRKIAIHLDEGIMKKPKVWCDYNIVLSYFVFISAINFLCVTLEFVGNGFMLGVSKIVSIALFCVTLFLAYVNGSNSALQRKLYDISRKMYNKN